MPLIGWNNALSVHVEAIDADHQKLLNMLNEAHDGAAAGIGRERLGQLRDELSEYAATHLRHEEELFLATGYPHAAMHQQEHRAMMEWVRTARERFAAEGRAEQAVELLDYLKDWLFHHIGGTDRKMAAYLMQAGIK